MGTKGDTLRVGSDADLQMTVGMSKIRAQVVLRRAHVNEVGFEFINMDLENRHRLRRLLMGSLDHSPGFRGGKGYQRQ